MQIVIFALLKKVLTNAEVAHLVEHNLAKVRVAGSSPVFRSGKSAANMRHFFSLLPLNRDKPWWWNW